MILLEACKREDSRWAPQASLASTNVSGLIRLRGGDPITVRLLVALVLLLAAPAGASAAPFGELPSQRTGIANCVRATGAPGELVRRSNGGAAVLQAGATGLTQVAELAADSTDCPQAAARPGGAGIVAFPVLREAVGVDAVEVIQAAVRDPGGGWGPVADVLPAPEIANGNPLATAISDSGEALIAVALQPGRLQIRVARRAPGGAFGAPQTLFAARTGHSREPTVQAGMSASGEAVVAWSFRSRDGASRELWAATAAPGASFGAPARIGDVRLGSPFSLAVGAGGHALLAFATDGELRVASRDPGAGFAPATPVARVRDGIGVLPATAVDAGGGAVAAWQRASDWSVRAVVRAAPGGFGAPVTIAGPLSLGLPTDLLAFFSSLALDEEGEYATGESGPDNEAGHPRAAIAGGRVLLTWAGPGSRDGVTWLAAQSATLPLGAGGPERRVHGPGLRSATSVTPLLVEGGGQAAVWTDSVDEEDPRLHVAVEGATPAVDAAAPRVVVRPGRQRVLDPGDSLELRVTCSAACDVRAQVGSGLIGASGELSLARAGSGRVRLQPTARPIAPLREGPVRVRILSGAPGARTATARTLDVRLRRRPGPPRPRVQGAVARRDGDDIVVTWRTSRRSEVENLFVFATAGGRAVGYAEPRGGPRRFRARLRGAEAAREVSIFVSGELFSDLRRTRVRVRG